MERKNKGAHEHIIGGKTFDPVTTWIDHKRVGNRSCETTARPSSTQVNEGRKCWIPLAMKTKAHTVVGRGEESLRSDPGSELHLGGRRINKKCEDNNSRWDVIWAKNKTLKKTLTSCVHTGWLFLLSARQMSLIGAACIAYMDTHRNNAAAVIHRKNFFFFSKANRKKQKSATNAMTCRCAFTACINIHRRNAAAAIHPVKFFFILLYERTKASKRANPAGIEPTIPRHALIG